jgi:murein DD-endopeptidase MepM/ murein hydrolase activator NlpD
VVRNGARLAVISARGEPVKKYNTIIFVPNARSPFRKFTVSTRVLTIGAAAVALVMVAAILFGWAYFASAARDREYLREIAENARLKSATAQLTSRVNGLVRQLDDFDVRTRRLAIVAGLTDGLRGGKGGPAVKDDPDPGKKGGLLDSRLTALESQFAKRSTLVSSTPSVAPVRGIVNSGFGSRLDPFTGEGAFHQGLDISTRRDEPVLATAAGIVVRSGPSGDYGKSVEIAHRTGYRTIYGHLDTVLVREGQQVRRGERLGLAGSTGRSTGTHLHYEVRRGDRAVNPLEYILDAR